MNDKIDAAILKLKADASDVAFTGFVTNAHVEPPLMLAGEIWSHVNAEPSGKFADGHRIETSDIVQIHALGDSLWVTTRSGSIYGILSFTPLGWTYLSDFYQAHYKLNPRNQTTTSFYMPSPTAGNARLAKRRPERTKTESVRLTGKALKRELLGPKPDPKYMSQMNAFVHETVEVLKRNGVKITSHE